MTETIKNKAKAAKTTVKAAKDKVTEKKPAKTKGIKVEMSLEVIAQITDLYSKGYSNEDILKIIETFG